MEFENRIAPTIHTLALTLSHSKVLTDFHGEMNSHVNTGTS